MTLPDRLDGLRVAIVGFGRAHRAMAPRLLEEGALLRAYDQSPETADAAAALGLTGTFGPDYLAALLRDAPEIAFLTPGMPKHLPELRRLEAGGSALTGEAAYFLSRRRHPCIGITGSAGKTTTTSLVGEMLRSAGLRPSVCGNIGRPFAEALADGDDAGVFVGEFSSFQLSLCDSSPEIAAILNIRPNHLDIHRDFEDYRSSKWRIADFQPPQGVLVVGEDLRTEAVARGRGRVLSFAIEHGTDARVRDGYLELRGRRILPLPELRLRGTHNRENALAAALLAEAAGAGDEAIAQTLRSFPGVRHRQEIVAERGGVTFINDSIATAPDRALAAFRTFDAPILWLAGGYDKHLDYTPLLAAMASVREAFLFGPVGETLLRLLQGTGVPAKLYPDFARAVRAAIRTARAGDTVLLSPAAASYDEFRDFQQRGERFRELVEEATGAGA